jgi:PadR family transcriptional regulator, regulatory protein PadR
MSSPDLVRGNLDMMLLAILAHGPSHGYAVLQRLRERSNTAFDLPEGTVYPALHRLEKAGLLASGWDESSGRRRRVYSVTKRGRSVLKTKQTEWAGFVQAVEAVLRGAPWPTPA